MGSAITIDQSGDRQNFETAVLQASYDRPVLVDFFATWCGPCQMLKPVLERVIEDYDITLAKVDIDQYPDLATQYQVDGVPDVRVVIRGEVQPGFVGMVPEPKIREFLAEIGLRSQVEAALTETESLIQAQRYPEAKASFDRLFQTYPNHPAVTVAAARFLLQLHQADHALKLLNTIGPSEEPYYSQAQSIKGLAEFQAWATPAPEASDLEQRFAQGAAAVVAGEYDAALGIFLEIVGTDRQFRQDGARKAMLRVFELLGSDHPLVSTYRKQLMQRLY
ncbi:MAG: tetratricopeptide repeat protein [Prochlorothrix sp.]